MRLLLLAPLLFGCGPKKDLEPAPAWMTERGKNTTRLEIAQDLIDNDAVNEALLVLDTLRDEGFESPELDLLHGRALHKQGMLSEAERLLRTADEQMPRDARPDRALGVLYADLGEPDRAIEHLRRATELEPGVASGWNNLGFLLLSQKRHDEALEALQQAVALDGTVARYRNNLGYALAATGRTSDALRAFQSTAVPADAHASLALALELNGRPREAVAQYRKALELDPSHAAAAEGIDRLSSTRESP